MSVKAIDLRRGMAVNYSHGVWMVIENEKVAKGNWRSYQVVTLKNMKTGQMLKEERFRVDELFEQAMLERKEMEYLYPEGKTYVFMDPSNYEQVSLPSDLIGEMSVYLQPNVVVTVGYIDGIASSVELPFTVELTVKDTTPEVKGATATNQMKDAMCEGGAKVKVPAFVIIGTKIKVDTRSGEYLGRAQ